MESVTVESMTLCSGTHLVQGNISGEELEDKYTCFHLYLPSDLSWNSPLAKLHQKSRGHGRLWMSSLESVSHSWQCVEKERDLDSTQTSSEQTKY